MEINKKVSAKETITVEDYSKLNRISIDYAVMEKSSNIVVIPSDFGWSDVGSFQSLHTILDQDKDKNAVKMDNKDNFYNINSKNVLVVGDKRKITAIDLKDIVIVDTDDALLVASSKSTEKVKEIVEELKAKNEPEAFVHTKVYRPWGYYKTLEEGDNYKVKQLYIRPGKRISLQYHYHRSENWTVVNGIAEVIKGDDTITLKPSESIYIPATIHHRLYNPSKVKPLTVIEVQTGEYLGEDDIIRIEDDYKRTTEG